MNSTMKNRKNIQTTRLKSPPIYGEILAKNRGKEEDAIPEFCIKIACWLANLKIWALNILEDGDYPQEHPIQQLIKVLEKIDP